MYWADPIAGVDDHGPDGEVRFSDSNEPHEVESPPHTPHTSSALAQHKPFASRTVEQ